MMAIKTQHKLNSKSDTITSKVRQSNIELLRIVAMIMIVAHHFAVHGGFTFAADTLSLNRFWLQFIQIGGKIGVDIFVLISGYFLIKSQSVKINKIIRFWVQIFLCSFLCFLIFTIIGQGQFNIIALIKSIMPITFSEWWFASAYFILYLLSPYINKLLNILTKKQYRQLLLLLGICWCIFPTFTGRSLQGSDLLWFIYLYAFAGYLRLFGFSSKLTSFKSLLLATVITLVTFSSAVAFDILGTKIPAFSNHATFFYGMQKLPIFMISVLMFAGFLRSKIGYKKFVNTISAAMFGVYLIHDNWYVRQFLWKKVFHVSDYAESNLLIPYSLLVIAAVFIGCTIIELARIHLLEKAYAPLIDHVAARLVEKKVLR